jgi:hypothetical protein
LSVDPNIERSKDTLEGQECLLKECKVRPE